MRGEAAQVTKDIASSKCIFKIESYNHWMANKF